MTLTPVATTPSVAERPTFTRAAPRPQSGDSETVSRTGRALSQLGALQAQDPTKFKGFMSALATALEHQAPANPVRDAVRSAANSGELPSLALAPTSRTPTAIARYQQHSAPSRDTVEQSLGKAMTKVQAG